MRNLQITSISCSESKTNTMASSSQTTTASSSTTGGASGFDQPRKERYPGKSVLEVYPVTEKSSTIMVLRTGVPIIDCQEEYQLSDGRRTASSFRPSRSKTAAARSRHRSVNFARTIHSAMPSTSRFTIRMCRRKSIRSAASFPDRRAWKQLKERIRIVARRIWPCSSTERRGQVRISSHRPSTHTATVES